MHVLNKVLVYKEEGFDFNLPEEERIDEARSIAEDETEDYCGPVYDWRETETAGRWSDEYPKQVYFAQDNMEWFIAEINEALKSQRHELDFYLTEFKQKMGTDIEKSIPILMGDVQDIEISKHVIDYSAFALRMVANIASGKYNCDSYIFNAKSSTARIDKEDIEQIKQEPNKWAIVMFDYHY